MERPGQQSEAIMTAEEKLMETWRGDETEPLASICCITYNHEFFLQECLEGLFAQQTTFPFEVLVHDDASTDGTAAVVAEFEARFPNVLKPIYQSENKYRKGHNVNPEFNFVRARGRYIAICDGDDVWVDPLKLEKQVNFLEANPAYSLCFTDAQAIDRTGAPLPKPGGSRRDLSAAELQMTASIFTLTACFRNVFKEWPREFANARYGDLAIWSMLGDYGAGKFMSDIAPSLYRQHDDGMHSSASMRSRRGRALETMAALYSYRVRDGKDELAHRHLEDVFVHSIRVLGVSGIAGIARRALRRLVRF